MTTVSYALSGSAVAGTDYSLLSGVVTFPVGSSAQTIPVYPLGGGQHNDTTVTVTLLSSSDPTSFIGECATATIWIFDYAQPCLSSKRHHHAAPLRRHNLLDATARDKERHANRDTH